MKKKKMKDKISIMAWQTRDIILLMLDVLSLYRDTHKAATSFTNDHKAQSNRHLFFWRNPFPHIRSLFCHVLFFSTNVEKNHC